MISYQPQTNNFVSDRLAENKGPQKIISGGERASRIKVSSSRVMITGGGEHPQA